MYDKIEECIKKHSEQVMFDSGEAEYRIPDDLFDELVRELVKIYRKRG